MALVVSGQLAFEKYIFLRTYTGYIRESNISIQQHFKNSHVFINIFRTVEKIKKKRLHRILIIQ